MKKIIASIGAWSLYYLGNFVSKWMWNDFTYQMYNKLMITSIRIQDWGDLKRPWRNEDQSTF